MPGDIKRVFDCIGIGIGPSNLSLACLLKPVADVSLRLLERRSSFVWHEGLLLPDATIQAAFLKDLVTLVDPTSRFSFLAYLQQQKRFYQFLNARFADVKRREFDQYFRWACEQLDTLEFSRSVASVKFKELFLVETEQGVSYLARNIVLGVGRLPSVPPCAQSKLCDTLLHSSQFLLSRASLAGKRVVVVGGGQSGAELFLDFISRDGKAAPSSCLWMTRRANFLPIDDSPFTNEFFTPGYAEYFYRLSPMVRFHQLNDQKLASDGISMETLTKIYQAVYESRHLQRNAIDISLRTSTQLTEVRQVAGKWQLVLLKTDTGVRELRDADVVILATGYRHENPSWLAPIAHRLEMAGEEMALNSDFSAKWDGPSDSRIYVQNGGRAQWGVADPNLSLISWRSGKIIASLAGRQVYDLDERLPMIDWMPETDDQIKDQALA
ncbi:MAG: lysine N6-hydroxylase [Bradyrhizobium sp.]|jgi:lysine N6-hydroxylase|nr:lysine N6-hydroxylase [Bradyrhizobium sp.]